MNTTNHETTLKKIAEMLNISITTVSKALKNYPDVSKKTKEAVLEMVEKLNYTPNSFAVNLRTKESRIIGLIIPEVVHHFFSNVVKGIISEAEKHDYLVIILQSNESLALEQKQVNLLLNKRVDGILISLSNETNYEQHLKVIAERNIPLVMFDKICKLSDCSKVIIDDRKAAFEAVEHLIKKGCKKIAHIRGPLNPQNAIDRFMGYKKALETYTIPFEKELVFATEQVTFEEGYTYAQEIFKNHPTVDGIFCITDLVAAGVLTYCNEHNIKVPEQVKIIGFSNWHLSQLISPALSTVEQPDSEMGVAAFSLLLEEINAKRNNTPFEKRIVTLNTQVIARQSTLS